MPLTRSKQLVGDQECPRYVIQASTKSWIQYRNHDIGGVRMTVVEHYRGSANCLDFARGIV